jgi:ATP-dependent helicase/nuclease subunit B
VRYSIGMLSRAVFGWHLDGPRFPEEPGLGRIVVGPTGMIQQLALRFGLLKPFKPHAVRIGDFLSRLRAIDDGQRFYSRSFQTDPWGTARSLLALRDELIASGWEPRITGGGSIRLQLLAQIESNTIETVSCPGDLLPIIARLLEKPHKQFLREVLVVDNVPLLPPMWQRIIGSLQETGVALATAKRGMTEPTDLVKLTKGLDSRTEMPGLTGDGSFTIIEGDDEVQCAEIMTAWLQEADSENAVIIRGSSTSFVDQLLRKRHLPVLGNNSGSPLRGYAQLLPLALELAWTPIDPVRLLELLTLPHSPVPAFAADCFIFALRNQPGIGGDAWQGAWRTALARKQAAFERSGDDVANLTFILEQTERAWKEWLEPIPTYSASEGVPALQAMAICRRVRLHSLLSFQIHGDQVFAQTAIWAETLGLAIETCGIDRITRAQMDRMLESTMSGGYVADQPQAAPWTCVDQPGQIFADAQTVLWWGFVGNAAQPRATPWTADELQYLNEHGVQTERLSARIVRESLAWRRPMQFGKRLIAIKPRTVAGRAVAAHPFYHELAEQIDAAPQSVRSKIVRQAHEIYFSGQSEVCGSTIERVQIQPVELPSPRPIWQIAPGALPLRQESASSLERLLACPLSWLLQYVARIRPGNLLSSINADRAAGNLAHAIFAKLFASQDILSRLDIAVLAEHAFDELCPQIALPLLLPGKSLERSRLKNSISEAAVHLATMLAQAGFNKIQCEVEQSVSIEEFKFIGRSDMLLTDAKGVDVVLDLKLARKTSPRRKELSEGRAVQLALYAWMNHLQTGRPTFGGYYMVGQKQLLCSGPNSFPQHTYVQGRSLADTFDDVLTNYEQHRVHLDRGMVFATGVDIPSDNQFSFERGRSLADEEPPKVPSKIDGITLGLEPPCKICTFGKLCGKKGWTQ